MFFFLKKNQSQQHFLCLCINLSYTFPTVVLLFYFVIPFFGLTPSHYCACPKPGPGFPTSYVVVFLCLMRGSLPCWYWWNYWPSKFKLSFHNLVFLSLINIFSWIIKYSKGNFKNFLWSLCFFFWLLFLSFTAMNVSARFLNYTLFNLFETSWDVWATYLDVQSIVIFLHGISEGCAWGF